MVPTENNWLKWVILAAGFYVNTFVFATIYSFSSLFNDLLDKFHESLSRTAMLHAMFKTFGLTCGTFTGLSISLFGLRRTALIGGIMASVGFILSFLATSIVHLYISVGIIAGIGSSITSICATTAISVSFSGSQRLLALSIHSTGMSVGGALTPYMFDYFVKNYGLNGNFLLMGGIYLNSLPAAVLFSISRDILENKKEIEQKHTKKADTETETESAYQNWFSTFRVELERLKTDVQKIMHPLFITTVLATGFTLASSGGFYTLLLDILKWKGFSSDEALLGFPVTYGIGFIARLVPGIAKQFKGVNSFLCPIIFSLCGACGQLIFILFSGKLVLLIGCGFTGISTAGLISGIHVVIAQVLGQDQIALGVGIMYSTLGILSTVYGPTYGAIRDAGHSYDVVLYSTFAFQLLGTTLFLVAVSARKMQSKRNSDTPKAQDNAAFNIED